MSSGQRTVPSYLSGAITATSTGCLLARSAMDHAFDLKHFSDPPAKCADNLHTCCFLWSIIQMIFAPISRREDNWFLLKKNIVFLPYRWRQRWYLKVINCVCRENDLVPCGVFSELYSKLSFAGNILSFTPSGGISSGGYKTLFYTFFTVISWFQLRGLVYQWHNTAN